MSSCNDAAWTRTFMLAARINPKAFRLPPKTQASLDAFLLRKQQKQKPMKSNKAFIDFDLILVLMMMALLLLPIGVNFLLGIGGFGPTKEAIIHVERLYVDSGESSHYMVGGSMGEVYEVDNGIMLGVWNSDELYTKLVVGQTYKVTIQGNRCVNFLFQEYPYIIKVERISP